MSIYGDGIARVSEVLDSWKDGEGLIEWAVSLGWSYKEVRDHAASVGTHTHDLVENSIRLGSDAGADVEGWMHLVHEAGKKINEIPHSMRDEVRCSTHAWMDWVQDKTLVPEHLEESLLHPDLKVGGTPDFIGLVNGDRVLIDWKTSKRISVKHKVQLAAYWMMHNLHRPGEPIKYAGVVRLDKRMGVYEDMWWQDLSKEMAFFANLALCYHAGKALKL